MLDVVDMHANILNKLIRVNILQKKTKQNAHLKNGIYNKEN